MDDRTTKPQSEPEHRGASYGLLYLTQAYNRKEITFEQWLQLTKEWAERIIREHQPPRPVLPAPG